MLDDLGLAAAIPRVVDAWSARTGVRAFYRVDDHAAELLSPDAAVAFYRILQELLDNAARHARAHRVDVVLSTDGTRVVLVVEDDGVGFDVDAVADAHARPGLDGMFHRAALVEATLEVESTLDKGTSIFLRRPVQPSLR